ncbi:thiamine pyrophosphate-dependent dehydrogenase E1 component subunit alpha [Aquibaculum sediminis]|uniref:thiamine pyrophosphate-dependent dehydrogenase E1 component subunit alpha n=1 Tax=Aquibaculum sediminis TaxID=3231907 RepID=UPI00345232A5
MTPAPAAPQRHSNLDRPHLLRLYELMLRIRAFEELAVEAQKEGYVLGAIHPSIGQEAVAAGVCAQLRRDDLMLSTHRGHGHTLAKGADALAMMRELFGREGGTCGGKGGSMHIADFEVGMLGANGVVSANIPIAAGAAHAIKLRGGDRIVACLFGDGAINRGPFLEGLNWAKVFELPVLFVCEDNRFAATTRTSSMTAGPGAAARAEALDIPAETLDGNDLLAVESATRDAIAAIRAGGGPRLLHCRTYRMTGHTAVDPAAYRPAEEVAQWREADPIARVAALLQDGGSGDGELDAIAAKVRQAMEEVCQSAKDSPWPAEARAFEDVQDIGDPRERAY